MLTMNMTVVKKCSVFVCAILLLNLPAALSFARGVASYSNNVNNYSSHYRGGTSRHSSYSDVSRYGRNHRTVVNNARTRAEARAARQAEYEAEQDMQEVAEMLEYCNASPLYQENSYGVTITSGVNSWVSTFGVKTALNQDAHTLTLLNKDRNCSFQINNVDDATAVHLAEEVKDEDYSFLRLEFRYGDHKCSGMKKGAVECTIDFSSINYYNI